MRSRARSKLSLKMQLLPRRSSSAVAGAEEVVAAVAASRVIPMSVRIELSKDIVSKMSTGTAMMHTKLHLDTVERLRSLTPRAMMTTTIVSIECRSVVKIKEVSEVARLIAEALHRTATSPELQADTSSLRDTLAVRHPVSMRTVLLRALTALNDRATSPATDHSAWTRCTTSLWNLSSTKCQPACSETPETDPNSNAAATTTDRSD